MQLYNDAFIVQLEMEEAIGAIAKKVRLVHALCEQTGFESLPQIEFYETTRGMLVYSVRNLTVTFTNRLGMPYTYRYELELVYDGNKDNRDRQKGIVISEDEKVAAEKTAKQMGWLATKVVGKHIEIFQRNMQHATGSPTFDSESRHYRMLVEEFRSMVDLVAQKST